MPWRAIRGLHTQHADPRTRVYTHTRVCAYIHHSATSHTHARARTCPTAPLQVTQRIIRSLDMSASGRTTWSQLQSVIKRQGLWASDVRVASVFRRDPSSLVTARDLQDELKPTSWPVALRGCSGIRSSLASSPCGCLAVFPSMFAPCLAPRASPFLPPPLA